MRTDLRTGTVVRSTGSWHDIQVDERVVPCRVPGKSRVEDNSMLLEAGDIVYVPERFI